MSFSCCCGINRYKDENDENIILSLAQVIKYEEVENIVPEVVSKLFRKATQVQIRWSHNYGIKRECFDEGISKNHSKTNYIQFNTLKKEKELQSTPESEFESIQKTIDTIDEDDNHDDGVNSPLLTAASCKSNTPHSMTPQTLISDKREIINFKQYQQNNPSANYQHICEFFQLTNSQNNNNNNDNNNDNNNNNTNNNFNTSSNRSSSKSSQCMGNSSFRCIANINNCNKKKNSTCPDYKYGIYVPLFDEDDITFSAYLAFCLPYWDSSCLKKLDKLEKQLIIMFRRLNKIRSKNINNDNTQNRIQLANMNQSLFNITNNEVLELCGNLYEENPSILQTKVISYLCTKLNFDGGFFLFISVNSADLECNYIGGQALDPELRFQIRDSLLARCIQTKQDILLDRKEIEKNLGELKILEQSTQSKWLELLCIPLFSQDLTRRVIGVLCLYNIKPDHLLTKLNNLKEEREKRVESIQFVLQFVTTIIVTSIAFKHEKQMKSKTEKMLQVAMNIFRKLDDLPNLLREIMIEAKKLTNAERCSVFLLENESNELVAKVFDSMPTVPSSTDSKDYPKEIRIPATQGIAGQVASTGEILNIYDAYSHPLFYRGVDIETGYKTRNILCFPIKAENGHVMGIAQLCNKINGTHFTAYDEELARSFSVYCCISIEHSILYKNVQEAQHRNRLATELMTYHMQINEDNFLWLSKCEIRKPTDIRADFDSFDCVPRDVPEKDSTLAVLSMFKELNLSTEWRIPRSILSRFILMVKRGYRDPAYHNWTHAFSVAHFTYLCLRTFKTHPALKITELESLAFLIASLCHDLDHRGTNNSFQVTSNSVLAALYSSEGSVLERHHFNQTVCILNSDGCNVLVNLTRSEYQTVLDLIRDIILATDLAHHLKIISRQRVLVDQYKNAKVKESCKNLWTMEDRKMILYLLMTCSDLSDQSKGWENTRAVAALIYQEFFSQGDLEKAIGRQPSEQMDRDRACVPSLQIQFLDGIAMPCFQLLNGLIPQHGKKMIENIEFNKKQWQRLHDDIKNNIVAPDSFHLFQKDLSPTTPTKPTNNKVKCDSKCTFNYA